MEAFQTLIGTVKGGGGGGQALEEGVVSNPHRYGQRYLATNEVYEYAAFQTLIGTVKGRAVASMPRM